MLTLFLLELRTMKIIACGNAILDTLKYSAFLERVVCSAAPFVMLDSIEKIVIVLQMVSVCCAPMAR